ncbi:NADH-quinone oxidoreductase subunit NuoF [Pelotomaculum propionicicum]|uniref:NADP-reducing hydrogenase subunit HndC n=1 Tax=Pelotomaculum propionicicum TaxID=258475 RepID=A0A4Y7RMN9_9FIRM|nr:NADH-quinone oxidoreductase subunit NuoF [Pelotomaculum propionicicum]TEB10009.1 NADP-reducing hydrogenase subunit HndC [Pelotomaculum propionicicum]
MKVQSIEDLKAVKEEYLPLIKQRLGHRNGLGSTQVMVCSGTACTSAASQDLRNGLQLEIERHGLKENVKVFKTGCFGFCQNGPIVMVHPGEVFYCNVKPEDAKEIVETHLMGGQVVERLLYRNVDNQVAQRMEDIHFFQAQTRIVLHNCGVINPEEIGEYIARDGYMALAEVIQKNNPREVIEAIKRSGLRGRGGAGFPTGRKWEMAAAQDVRPKYVLCNADEGDPGAFMDRSILEGDPHSVIEAMAVAGYCIGASQGYIYVRAEYPIAVKRLEIAIEQAREKGLLGKNLFGSSFDFDLGLRFGAGAFVCGEETALIHSVMGQRGEPRPRPPYPAQEGLWGKPTLINNVETYANIPAILRNGWEWYQGQGTAGSKGSKVFSLAGKINNTGLIEVPMGTTLRTIIFDIGGGIPGGKKFKAVQTGGPSGGCIPEKYLDMPIDYESLKEIGSMMGSGGMIVMNEDNCMVDIARFYLEFTQDESCGRCTPCRVGTKRLLETLKRITEGNGEIEDLELLEELSFDIRDASLCGLGQTAPNPVISTMRYFKDEYLAHIKDKNCPAGVCKELLNFVVDEEKCAACGICAKDCAAGAITGKPGEAYRIDPDKCSRCAACAAKCPKKAITRGPRKEEIINGNQGIRPGTVSPENRAAL